MYNCKKKGGGHSNLLKLINANKPCFFRKDLHTCPLKRICKSSTCIGVKKKKKSIYNTPVLQDKDLGYYSYSEELTF